MCLYAWLDLTHTHPPIHTHPPTHTHTHFNLKSALCVLSYRSQYLKGDKIDQRPCYLKKGKHRSHFNVLRVLVRFTYIPPERRAGGFLMSRPRLESQGCVSVWSHFFFFYISLHFVLLLCPVALCVLSFFLLLAHSPDLLFPKSPFPKGWLFCVALVFLLVWAVRRWMQYYTGICL